MLVDSKLKSVQRPAYEEKCCRDGKMSTVYMIAAVSTVVVLPSKARHQNLPLTYVGIGNVTLGQSSTVLVYSGLWYSP